MHELKLSKKTGLFRLKFSKQLDEEEKDVYDLVECKTLPQIMIDHTVRMKEELKPTLRIIETYKNSILESL